MISNQSTKIIWFFFTLFSIPTRTKSLSFTPMHSQNKQPIPRLVLLDRDGVINHDVGAPGVLQPSQLSLTRNASIAIKNFRNHGCKVAIITNQSCVGKGLITEKDLSKIHDTLLDLLTKNNDDKEEYDDDTIPIDHIFYCTSLRNSGDYRMKPNPGMIQEACEMFDVQPSECVMIGDALRDLQSAATAGVQNRILVQTGYGLGIMNDVHAPAFDDIHQEPNTLLIDEEYCKLNGYEKGFQQQDNDKNSILPFHYASDLYTASCWILRNVHSDC